MNSRALHLALLFALTSIALPPFALAEDKKKKNKQPSQAELLQQWKQEEVQRQQAAARAAANRNKPMPQSIAPAAADKYIVHVYNRTGSPVQVIQISSDGNTLKQTGIAAPYGPPDNTDFGIVDEAGAMFAFAANGQVIERYTISNNPDQELNLGPVAARQTAPAPMPRPLAPIQPLPPTAAAPAGDGYVQVTVLNQTATPLEAVRFLPDESSKSFGTIQAGDTSTLRTRPGMRWVFSAGGQPVQRYIVTNAAQQQIAVGRPTAAAPPAPVPIYAKVQLLISNQTGVPIQGSFTTPDGSGAGRREIYPSANGEAATVDTVPGTVWTFRANGQVLKQFTVPSNMPQQPIAFGPLAP